MWAKVPVYSAALAVGRQAGLSNPNQDSFLPLGDAGFLQREERAGLSGSSHQVKEVSDAHNGFSNSPPSLRGWGSWGGSFREASRSTEHREVVRHQELLTKAKVTTQPHVFKLVSSQHGHLIL